MVGMMDEVERILQAPIRVLCAHPAGWEMVCVVVKYLPIDVFVITAYLTDTVKAGEILWPIK
jgi:hypothetical protein